MDLICFSHLRWNFVYQRPQHLMANFTRHFRVFFIEEPIFGADKEFLDTSLSKENVWVIVPHLCADTREEQALEIQQRLISQFFRYFNISEYIFWYYTPMALTISHSFIPEMIVYDCMDELSAFKNAPPILRDMEKKLIGKADIVFTGGNSLYHAKQHLHSNIMSFPSSIDKKHFGQARSINTEPADQLDIPHPRIGFFGVIDERMDIHLLDIIAKEKPDWHFVIIGPVVKIDPATLPKYSNIHYLGSKSYDELPSYLAGWDVAMMPFALNESTRFISPTKTPEYLAGGKPVVSTAIRDVIFPYGENGLVAIAHDPDEFIHAIEEDLTIHDKHSWLERVDAFLAEISWEQTAEKMLYHINMKLASVQNSQSNKKEDEYV